MDRWLRRFLGALIVYLMVLGGVRWILSNAFGPPANSTGSPGDGGASCTACHTGPAGNSANVTLSGVPSSYTPGQAYNLTLTVGSAGGKRGFEIVSERDSNNTAVGSWSSLGSGVQTNGDSLSHQSASSNNSWTFTWTAPNPGVAGITFYIAGNVADGLGSTSGDQINLRSYAVPQAATPAPAITGLSPAFGSVGANITLTGTDFTSTLSTVNFSGGTSTSSVVSWADTSIVAKATGSASGNVTVTNANGTSGGASFTLITGAPSLSSATPQAVDRASGTVSIRVSGANLSPGSTVTLSTTTPGAAVSSAAASAVALTTSTQITTATFNLGGMATGYWTLSVTNPDASSGTLAGALLVQIRPDAPQSLQALVLSSTTILWSWTAVGGNADTLRLYTSTGGVASPALSPPTSTYLESLYSPNEAALRSIAAFNAVGSSNSAVLTTATFANAPVSAASTFTSVGVSSAVVAWGNGGNASGTQYTALLSTRTPLTLTDAGLLAVTTAPSGSPSAPFSNLTPDTSYYLFVRAVNRQGGDTAYTALGSTVTYPAEPGSAASTFSAVAITSMTASWNANGNPGGTLYEAVLSTATPLITTHSGNITVSTRPEGGPSGLFGNLSADSSYYLFVRAVGRTGAASGYSALGSTVTSVNEPVTAVSTFSAVNITSMTASWGANGNPAGTRYEAILSTATPLIATNAGNIALSTRPEGSPSGLFTILSPDTSYYLFVRTVGRIGNPTPYSSLGSTVTVAAEPGSAASTFSAVAITSMTASWGANGNPGGTLYEAILSTATPLIMTNAGNIALSTRPESSPSGLFQNLLAASTYHLFVRAVGRTGNPTPYSSPGSTATAAAEPGSAASTFSAVAVTSMTTSWNANGNPGGTLYEAILSTASPLITTNAGNIALSTRPEGGPSGLFTNLSADSTYYLFARAFGPGGVPTGYAALGSTASLADKPSGSTVTAVSSSAITLAWSGGSNPSDTLYEVSYSSVDAFLSGASISTAARAPGASAAIGGLAASTTYYLRVRALNRRGVPTEFAATVSTLTAPPLPAVPGTPSGASLGVSSISWSWVASTYSLSYEVYSASSGALLASPASPAFTQTGLSTNTAYGIRTRGINATGASPLSAAATTYSAAAQPGQPSVSGRTSNSISLGWDASGNPSGTRYEVSLSTDDFALNFSTPVPLSSNLTASATTFTGLQLGATYYARIRAYNGDSTPSGFSSRVSTLTLNFPDPPSGLAAAALSTTTLLWTWTDASSDEAGFRVYSATAGKVSPDLSSNTTFWLQTGLSADASAQNRVVSFAQGGAESPASSAVRRFTLARIPLGGFALPVAGSSVSLRISWSSGGASGFSLERATASAGTYGETASSQALSAQTTSYLNQPLSASTTYFYRLRAYNGDGAATDYGTVFSTRTHPAIPASPSLSGAALSSTSIRWSWSAVAGADEYALKTDTGALILSLSAGTTEALESGLQPGAVYARLLTASNPVGLSTSAAASVSTPQTALAVPAASSAAFTVAGASLSIPSGWLPGAGSVLASADPLNKPLTPTVAQDVSNANAVLGFLKAVPGTLRQFLAYEGTTRRETDFLAAVTLSLEYPDADGNGIVDGTQIGADTLAVYFLREGGSSWTKLSGGSVDKANRRVSAPTTHFTLFTLAGGAAASDISGVRVFPNPLRPGLGHTNMTFRLLPASARVRIYTLAGERVAELEGDASGVAQWDGRNSSGRSAASGVYLAVVEGNGEKRTLKVAIQK